MVSDQLKLSAIQVEVKSLGSKDTCQSFSFDLGIVPFCGEKRAKKHNQQGVHFHQDSDEKGQIPTGDASQARISCCLGS